ncbi:proteinase inhibitor PSI-1.2-like [Rhodamnia argentea]|uniref:Proteinase inhibitor PSI-1.2-like n=1 Tax=Rhodamnia argentea TaxID=178133 RepID=A0ABM3HMC3_9MYRT|nr:proteinase inhibitor PSI-1.2-like [Rhodamnia argentea]
MARCNACCMVLLLVCGALLLDMNPGMMAISAVACPQYCLQVDYMTCPSTGNEHLSPRCNCCLAPKGCTLHLTGGGSISCS